MPEPNIAVRDGVIVAFGEVELTGSLLHDRSHDLLELVDDEGPESLATSLRAYGLLPAPGNVFIKDWSEHAGLTAALESQGLVKKVRELSVGPFSSTAFEVEITL